ncbi:MAG: hypothetical protein QM270_06795 [Bacillota bacterium]|nr:hypothetical protein [Bacillota bacterium]
MKRFMPRFVLIICLLLALGGCQKTPQTSSKAAETATAAATTTAAGQTESLQLKEKDIPAAIGKPWAEALTALGIPTARQPACPKADELAQFEETCQIDGVEYRVQFEALEEKLTGLHVVNIVKTTAGEEELATAWELAKSLFESRQKEYGEATTYPGLEYRLGPWLSETSREDFISAVQKKSGFGYSDNWLLKADAATTQDLSVNLVHDYDLLQVDQELWIMLTWRFETDPNE